MGRLDPIQGKELWALVEAWPQLAELRPAAERKGRWVHALSSLSATSRAEMAAALHAARALRRAQSVREEIDLAVLVFHGTERHEALRLLQSGGLVTLANMWHLSPDLVAQAHEVINQLVGREAEWSTGRPTEYPQTTPEEPTVEFPHALAGFGAALAAGWTWDLALPAFAGISSGWFDAGGRAFWAAASDGTLLGAGQPGDWQVCRVLNDESELEVIFFIQKNHILAITSNKRFQVERPPQNAISQGSKRNTRFLPAYIRLPRDKRGRLLVPEFPVTAVVERRNMWKQLLGNIDAVTWAIISWKMVYLRRQWILRGSWLKNHPSWEVPRVKMKLGLKFGAYLFQGALEVVLWGCRLPIIIEPLGAVVKKGPDEFRAISDARKGNKGLNDWGVRYFSAREFADLLDWCYLLFGGDIRDAYHIAPFAGCTGDLVWGRGVVGVEDVPGDESGSETSEEEGDNNEHCQDGPEKTFELPEDPSRPSKSFKRKWHQRQRFVWGWRLHVGCSPETCQGTCDKSANGLETDGCIMRWAVAHFGQKVAGSPLNCLVLCLLRHLARRNPAKGEKRGASRTSILGAAWVDDLGMCKIVRYHGICEGLEGGCSICGEYVEEGRRSQEYFIWLCKQLGIGLAEEKHQWLAQRLEYAGFLYDTVRGLLLILGPKLEKVVLCLQGWASAEVITLRGLDSVRGRILHYSLSIRHLRILATEITWLIGTEEEPAYDEELPVSDDMRNLASEIEEVTKKYAPQGCALWPAIPSSLYGGFLRGETGPGFAVATWDSGPHGWAALWKWWSLLEGNKVLEERLMVGTWPAGSAVTDQAHREGLGGCLMLEAMAQEKDLTGWTVILRNDAESALAAFRKGSSHSRTMQELALRFNRICVCLNLDTFPIHVPGKQMVAEGIDGASRAGAYFGPENNVESVLGPRVTDELWMRVLGVTEKAGWRISVDLFASAANTRAARFVTRFPEPGAEATDALSVPDWAYSQCPGCGQIHWEVVYAFPPPGLCRKFVRKAMADGVQAVIVVALAVTEPYWHKLVRSSVVQNDDGYIRIRRPRNYLTHAGCYDPRELALFACDFRRNQRRPDITDVPACAGHYEARPHELRQETGDEIERAHLRRAHQHLDCWRGPRPEHE